MYSTMVCWCVILITLEPFPHGRHHRAFSSVSFLPAVSFLSIKRWLLPLLILLLPLFCLLLLASRQSLKVIVDGLARIWIWFGVPGMLSSRDPTGSWMNALAITYRRRTC